MSLINCEVSLTLIWSKFTDITTTDAQGDNPVIAAQVQTLKQKTQNCMFQ